MGSKFSQISGVVLCSNKFLAIVFALFPWIEFRTLLFDYIPALLKNQNIFHITITIYVLTNSQIFTNKKTTCTWIVLVGISKIQVWSTQLFGQVDRQVVTLHCSNSRAGKNLRGVHCTMSQTLQKKFILFDILMNVIGSKVLVEWRKISENMTSEMSRSLTNLI